MPESGSEPIVGEVSGADVDAVVESIYDAVGYNGPRRSNLEALRELLIERDWLPADETELVWRDPWQVRDKDRAGYDALVEVLRDVERRTRSGDRPFRIVPK